MRTSNRLLAILLLALLAVSGNARAVDGSEGTDERMRAELLGKLTFTKISLHFDGVPAHDAFQQLATALSLTIVGRYLDDRIGHGIDPEAPVTLVAENIDGLHALELMLEQSAEYDPVTWQLRDGFVEIGTKERLSTPAASESRTYHVRDLMLEAPYFGNAPLGNFYSHPYQCASLTRPVESRGGVARKRPELLMLEVVQGIVETIEPGNWEYGQVDDEEEESETRAQMRTTERSNASQPTYRAPSSGKIAQIRAYRDLLLITAPDFIHRQINGDPKPIRPGHLSVEECLDRSERASTDDARITVLGIEHATNTELES